MTISSSGEREAVIPKATAPARTEIKSEEDKSPPNERNNNDSSAQEHAKRIRTHEFKQDSEQNRKLRSDYAEKAYILGRNGVAFWIAVIFANSFITLLLEKPLLSDSVIIAITAASTVNLLGAFLGVIRGLFPPNASN